MFIQNAYCRTFQGCFSVVNKAMSHREPEKITGIGCFSKIPDILSEANRFNPMIVTGPRIGKSDEVLALKMRMPGAFIFAEVKPDPPASQIEEMAKLYREHDCDSIVAIGGGSNLDAGKAMGAIIASKGKSICDLGGIMKVKNELPFFIAVPTTAGTGSECTVAAVITDDRIGRKYAINDPVLCPNVALLDPKMTVTLPKTLTAYTGMDALTHAVEAYLNKRYYIDNTKKMAEDAIVDIFRFLPRAFENGEDLEAREKMLNASYMAGIAFTVSCVGNVHAIAHTLGGQYHIQHGLANAVALPYVLSEYRPKCDSDFAALSDLLGLCKEGNTSQKADAFLEAIIALNRSLEIPSGFDVVEEENIDKMAKWANKEANPLYPCPVIFSKKKFGELIHKIGCAK